MDNISRSSFLWAALCGRWFAYIDFSEVITIHWYSLSYSLLKVAYTVWISVTCHYFVLFCVWIFTLHFSLHYLYTLDRYFWAVRLLSTTPGTISTSFSMFHFPWCVFYVLSCTPPLVMHFQSSSQFLGGFSSHDLQHLYFFCRLIISSSYIPFSCCLILSEYCSPGIIIYHAWYSNGIYDCISFDRSFSEDCWGIFIFMFYLSCQLICDILVSFWQLLWLYHSISFGKNNYRAIVWLFWCIHSGLLTIVHICSSEDLQDRWYLFVACLWHVLEYFMYIH